MAAPVYNSIGQVEAEEAFRVLATEEPPIDAELLLERLQQLYDRMVYGADYERQARGKARGNRLNRP